MTLAVRLGVAPRVLWGWSPAEVHEYDDEGRMVRTVTESPWSPDQYDLVTALAEVEATECPGCHQPLEECMGPVADPDNWDAERHYVAGDVYRCHACTAREMKFEALRKPSGSDQDPLKHASAVRIPVHVVEGPRIKRPRR